jgi:hypothetical protein
MGLSHLWVAAICDATSLACSAVMLVSLDRSHVVQATCLVASCLLVAAYLAAPSLLNRRRLPSRIG